MFKSASMNLRDYVTNDIELRQLFHDAGNPTDLQIKLLGLKWDLEKDTIIMSLPKALSPSPSSSLTKRKILQFTAFNFDPPSPRRKHRPSRQTSSLHQVRHSDQEAHNPQCSSQCSSRTGYHCNSCTSPDGSSSHYHHPGHVSIRRLYHFLFRTNSSSFPTP